MFLSDWWKVEQLQGMPHDRIVDGTWLWMQKSNRQTETHSPSSDGFVEGKLTEIPTKNMRKSVLSGRWFSRTNQSIETRDAPIVCRQNQSPFSKQSRFVRRSAFQTVFCLFCSVMWQKIWTSAEESIINSCGKYHPQNAKSPAVIPWETLVQRLVFRSGFSCIIMCSMIIRMNIGNRRFIIYICINAVIHEKIPGWLMISIPELIHRPGAADRSSSSGPPTVAGPTSSHPASQTSVEVTPTVAAADPEPDKGQ